MFEELRLHEIVKVFSTSGECVVDQNERVKSGAQRVTLTKSV